MSYVLHLWEQPVGQAEPATVEEALRAVQDVLAAGAGPGSNVLAALKELPAELGPIAAPDTGVLAIAIPAGDRLRWIRRTVDVARSRKLTVLDDQLGLLFLSSGAVRPQEGARLWRAVVEELDATPASFSRSKARAEIRRLEPLLRAEGFQRTEDERWDASFVRSFAGGHQTVEMYIDAGGSELRCAVMLGVVHERVVDVYEQVCGKGWVRGGREWSVMVSLSELLGETGSRGQPCAGPAEVATLSTLVLRNAVPFLRRCEDLAEVDRVVNREGRFPVLQQRFAALIVAALTGNPDVEAIADRLRTVFARRGQEVVDTLERLVGSLRLARDAGGR